MSAVGPLVSIVTPSYNQAAYLEATIQSVLAQDYPQIEYIVIDGGSADGSVEIIRRYKDRLSYWVSEPDAGQAQAINKGLSRATGSILAWLNSDDTYTPGAVRRAVAALAAHPEHDLAYANCDYVDTKGRLLQRVAAWDFVPRRVLSGIPLVIQPASFFRRRALERAGLLDESLQYLMDHDYFVRMVLLGLTFLKVEDVWAHFRWHAASKTSQQWVGFNLELQQIIERTFTPPTAGLPAAWRREARANAWQSLGEAYSVSGQPAQARSALVQALRAAPIRPKSVMALALMLDLRLGTHLAARLRRWRYHLPDAPAGGQPFEMIDV